MYRHDAGAPDGDCQHHAWSECDSRDKDEYGRIRIGPGWGHQIRCHRSHERRAASNKQCDEDRTPRTANWLQCGVSLADSQRPVLALEHS